MLTKSVQDSFTEQIQILMPSAINGASRLFGGQLMEWIDVVAAVTARRHSGCDVTTACVDHLEFSAPAHINSTIILQGRVTYVGNTSMEVRVDTFVESLSGNRRPINRAYLVLVAIDENEQPVVVPRLALGTDEERTEWDNGVRRTELRRKRREERY